MHNPDKHLAKSTKISTVLQFAMHRSLDELIDVYLSNSAPEQFSLRHEDVWLEIKGLRGSLEMHRLALDDFFDVLTPSQLETADDSAAHRQRGRLDGHHVG
jgi:hypothetical protein